MTIAIRQLKASDFARWDEFVMSAPKATFFHRAGWKSVIERAFGHRCLFLYAEFEGRIAGVLPLAEVKSLVFGHSLASLPFCVYGGPVAESEEAGRALDGAAQALAAELGVDHLEYRCIEAQHADWAHKDLHVTFRKEIPADADQAMAAIPRKQRAMVRKGIAAGLQGEIDEDCRRLFDVYAASVHRLGTPVFSRRYFEILREVFGKDCEVLNITRSSQVVASVMSFYFRDQVLPYYAGSTMDARSCAGNDFMYWDLMRRACERGIRVFDFGRSKVGSGSFDFKKNWGFEPTPLHYELLLVRAKKLPETSARSPKLEMMVKVWQRLPLSVANFIGPRIAGGLPW